MDECPFAPVFDAAREIRLIAAKSKHIERERNE